MEKFTKQLFISVDQATRAQLCTDLAQELTARLTGSTNLHTAVRNVVDDLRRVGHDLWSLDESDDFEVWGPNYESPTGPGLVITFSVDDGVDVEWSRE
jgi:hypothetical protein